MLRKGRYAMAVWALVGASLLSCSDKTNDTTTSPPQGAAPAQASAKDEAEKALRKVVEQYAEEIEELLAESVGAGSVSQGLQERIAASLKRSEERKTDGTLAMDLRYDDVMQRLYETRDYKPILVKNYEFTDSAKLLLQEVQHIDRHLLAPESYPLDRLQTIINAKEEGDFASLRLSDEEKQGIVKYWAKKNGGNVDTLTPAILVEALLKDKPLPSLEKQREGLKKSAKEQLRLSVEAEVLLLDAWLKFARDLSLSNLNAVNDEEEEFIKPRLTDAKRLEIIYKRLDAHLAELTQALAQSPLQVQQAIQQIYPPHEQYEKLLHARELYKEIVAAGGWETVKQANIRWGRSAPHHEALKKRLQVEGLYKGEIDDVADDALKDAVLLYKETHQMDDSSELNVGFWRSLNMDAPTRLLQIETNIKRWQASYMLKSPYYIFINVPDFHAELWNEGQLLKRFPIVVGNAKQECDAQTGEMVYVNATPLQRARMLYIEYNPYWNVPVRIEQEEYLPKIHADPDWLEKNGYEYHTEKNYTILRQLPGERNALGRVKFIFPNKHATFMHDTPQKGLFRHPTRAFSHGCMRVWEPMELAQMLLEIDGQWDESILKEIDENLRPKRIVLKNRFEVFSDYYTVRVDERGYVNFLADPYQYVRKAMFPPKGDAKPCTAVERKRLARPNADGTIPGADKGEDVGIDIIPLDEA